MFAPSKKQPVDQSALNVRARSLGTNEQTRPLQIFCGTQRLGTTFFEAPFDFHTGTSRQGDFVWASWALGICMGPVDKLYQQIWDDTIYWEGEETRAGLFINSRSFIFDRDEASMRIYWGTETQGQDPELAAYRNHPAYRLQSWARFNNKYIGINRNALPNIEFVMGRWPKPGWWTAPVDGDGYPKIGSDCNPVAFVAELMQSPIFGLGLPDARLDLASWNAVATTLANEGVGISPVVNTKRGLKAILADVFAIIDAHLFPLANGKIGLNLIRAPGGGLALLDESKWIGGVQLNPEGWADTINALTLAYTNSADNYNTETAQFIDRGNFEITGTVRAQTLQRPWITSQALAQKVALANGARLALPQVRGTIKARKSAAKMLAPGMAFQITCVEQGLAAVTVRVLEQTLPAPKDPPEVTLSWELDRSYLNADFYAPTFTPPPPLADSLDPTPMKVMEWPWMREHTTPKILALSGRFLGSATLFFAHKQWPSGTYELMETSKLFARHGAVVDANYPASTNVIDDGVGLVVQLDTFDNTIDNVPISDALLDEWLVIVEDEICSAFGATLLAAGKYRLFLARGRFDTVRAAHNVGAEVWVVKRQEALFYDAIDEMGTQAWKLQQLIAGVPEDLGALAASTFNTAGRFYRPIEPGNLAAFGDRMNPVYTTGQAVPLTWSILSERVAAYWDLAEPRWTEEMPDTVLEFWTVGGVLKQTVEVALAPAGLAAGTGVIDAYTLANSDLVSWFGAEVSFDVRAYHRRNGFRSARFASLRVTKV